MENFKEALETKWEDSERNVDRCEGLGSNRNTTHTDNIISEQMKKEIASKELRPKGAKDSQRIYETDYTGYHCRPRYKNTLHLWEFLLQLLTDERAKSIICWSRKEHGEFKIKDQEEIAKRWGALKKRPGMNYDKLSRAIRSYYSRQIITKVPGQKLVYKFDKLPYEYMPKVVESHLTKRQQSGNTTSFCSQLPSPSYTLSKNFNLLSLSTAVSSTSSPSHPVSTSFATSSAATCQVPLAFGFGESNSLNLPLKLPSRNLDDFCQTDEPQSAPPHISTVKFFSSVPSDSPTLPPTFTLERRRSIPVSVITRNTGIPEADF